MKYFRHYPPVKIKKRIESQTAILLAMVGGPERLVRPNGGTGVAFTFINSVF